MKITPTPLTISQLFSSNNEQFYIPAYQRRYSWEFKQLAELFDDIDLLKTDDTHLLGSIVCLTDNHIAGINTLEIVDGQQRITTITILFKSIKRRFKKLKENELSQELDNFLFCKGIDRKQKNKVLLGDLDDPDYMKLLSGRDFDKIKNNFLIDAFEYFNDWLADYDLDDLNTFYFKLINNVTIIRLDVGQAKDAYKLFETINNRGLRLSATDIIKNFLLGHASTFDDEILAGVKDNWKQLIINLDNIDTDDFFRQFMSSILKRKITKSKLNDGFKKYYLSSVKGADSLPEYEMYNEIDIEPEPEDEIKSELNNDNNDETLVQPSKSRSTKISIIEFSKFLNDSSSIYEKLLRRKFKNNKLNRHLFNLQRIKSFPSYIFLLDLFRRDIDVSSKIRILKLIETFMLRRHICESRTGELDDIFSSLVDIPNENIIYEIESKLKKHLPNDNEFRLKFASHNYKGNSNRAKYVLEMIEYELIEDKGEYVLNTGDDVHLEHIIPQTIDTKKSKREFGNWEKYLGDNALDLHKDYVNRIGNLTIIAGRLNIVASNNPFRSKIKEYKKSNIKLTKLIVDEFSEFKYSQVEERSKNLAAIAPKIWSFSKK